MTAENTEPTTTFLVDFALKSARFVDELAGKSADIDDAGYLAATTRSVAVRHAFVETSEALHALPAEARSLAPDIPWHPIKALRNHLAHDCWNADDLVVRRIARIELANLSSRLEALRARLTIQP